MEGQKVWTEEELKLTAESQGRRVEELVYRNVDADPDQVEDYNDYESDYESAGVPDVPDEEKTPVTIVTGFLGAGKTTLVNYILKEQKEMKIAIIENEYGAVSIDTELVSENIRQDEEIVTMENGCVCCTVRGDLVRTLIDFLDKRKTFDCILLETTGIADPSPIVETFNQEVDVRLNYRVDSVLCLVDSKHITQQLDRKPTGGSVNEAAQQIAFADCILINKTDLVTKEELALVRKRIQSVNAFAKIMETQKSRVSLSSVLNLNSFNLERTLELLDKEAKEEAEKDKAEAAAKAKAAEQKCGEDCSHDHHDHHDHQHGHNDHKHDHDGHKHNHSSEGGENHSHDHSDSHTHETHEGENGNGKGHKRKSNDEDGNPTPTLKKAKVSSTRHDSRVGSIGLTLDGNLDVDLFNEFMGEFLRENSQNLFRSKGVLAFAGQDQKFVFQGVHESIKCEPSAQEWQADGAGRQSKIVFIGMDLDSDYIVEGINKCRLP